MEAKRFHCLVAASYCRYRSVLSSELKYFSFSCRRYTTDLFITLLLKVFYLDNLKFGPSTPYHCLLPRATAYLPDFMSKLILLDCTGTSEEKLMLFGKTEVKEITPLSLSVSLLIFRLLMRRSLIVY